jgi:hypothetical protein
MLRPEDIPLSLPVSGIYAKLDEAFAGVPYRPSKLTTRAYDLSLRRMMLIDPESERRWGVSDSILTGNINFTDPPETLNSRDANVNLMDGKRSKFSIALFGERSVLSLLGDELEFGFEADGKSPEQVFRRIIGLAVRQDVVCTILEP